jgi:hypothetical protein
MRGSHINVSRFMKVKVGSIPIPTEDDDYNEPMEPIMPMTCCDPIDIIWWYKSIGSDDYGIHVKWNKWENMYHELKLRSNETFPYYHEYFHHVCDSWSVKHGLGDKSLAKQYQIIWTKEEQKEKGYTAGILLGEALAEDFAKLRQKSFSLREKKHPSYSLEMGDWAFCSLFHVYQILNKNYEIFERPIDPVVADRELISGLNKNYEEFEDELYSASMGFCRNDTVYENAKDSPQTIPFYVHGHGQEENWKSEVQEFCKINNLSKNLTFVD